MIMGLLEPIVSGFPWTQQMVLSDENGVPISEDLLNDCDIKIKIMDEACCRAQLTVDASVLEAGTIEWTFQNISLCQGRYALVVDVYTEDPDDSERIAHFTLPITRN